MEIVFLIGPYNASQMSEWYRMAFLPLNMLVRRACDEKFLQLGDLVLFYGEDPFMSQTFHPPIKVCTSKNYKFYIPHVYIWSDINNVCLS